MTANAVVAVRLPSHFPLADHGRRALPVPLLAGGAHFPNEKRSREATMTIEQILEWNAWRRGQTCAPVSNRSGLICGPLE